ncbi:MAG TPA: two-component regulator propeller domain-containing protein, partial [Pyrinomonadaceae bacterium]|nr:two-component regulator propeller domain-containing protein [Pyrinomonadaceae bacterium]
FWDGLYRLSPDGATVLQYFTSTEGLPRNYGARSTTISALLEDKEGNLWAGTRSEAVCQLAFDSKSDRYAVSRCYGRKDGLHLGWVDSMLQSSDGSLWIGTNRLNRISGRDPTGKFTFQSFTNVQGLCDDGVFDIAEDHDGNLWVGTACGLKKWTPSGFTGYDTKDGLSSLKINSFLETSDGELIVTDAKEVRKINLFSQGKFKVIRPNYPSEIESWGWGWRQTVLQTHDGEWWVTVGMSAAYMNRFKAMPPDGPLVVRFPKVNKLEDLARIKPKAVYRPRDGLFGYNSFRLYEDHNGDVWIVTLDPTRLYEWEPKTEKFQEFTEAADMGRTGYIYVLREDRAGNLWMGAGITFRHDENQNFSLMRYHNGRFNWFTTADGLPEGTVRDLLIDGVGRLWIATSRGGVLRVDDPNAEHPHFTAYTTAQGLSDNTTSSLTEDRFGRIYIGSGRGVDRFDPTTGAVKHFTTTDGLPRGEIFASYRDLAGALWFGSDQGLARHIPEPEHPRQPPNILLTGLRASNVEQQVSAVGETELSGFEFQAAQNNLSVDFLGVGTSLGEELRYKYELEGADANWITTSQRTVNFSNLAPGKYRLLVKATTAEGIESVRPAGFTFTILPPVWQRWWFLLLVTGFTAAALYSLYRYNVSQAIKLERVRTRIAADLHDDIGSNLSVIAGLSDVLRRQANGANAVTGKQLSLIATVSQRSLEAISDIVWAVNPRKDHLVDLVQRLRLFADEAFFTHHIEFRFSAADAASQVRVGAETRREVFLIFKEAVNNIIRHSGCAIAAAQVHLDRRTLALEISDDGKGFDPQGVHGGEGLASMRRRAEKIGARIEVVSKPGAGSTIRLRIPLARTV